jgi:uncharacterized damage-inducible protein DinB
VNVEDCRVLFSYNSWANRRILDACSALNDEQFTRDLKSSFGSVRDTLVHASSGEWVWIERWHGRTPAEFPKAVDYPTVESVRRRFTEIDRDLVDWVASLTDGELQQPLAYRTMAGEAQAQPLWQLLQHVANHGTYHRGQVATMLRQLGTKAVSTDLIAYYREQAAKLSA